MDTMQARYACLKLVMDKMNHPFQTSQADDAVTAAKTMADFVIGEPRKESASFGKRGADDPKKPGEK